MIEVEQVSDYAFAQELNRWHKLNTRFFYLTLGWVFVMISVVENVPKQTAKWSLIPLITIELAFLFGTLYSNRRFSKLFTMQCERSKKRVKEMYDRFEQESATKNKIR